MAEFKVRKIEREQGFKVRKVSQKGDGVIQDPDDPYAGSINPALEAPKELQGDNASDAAREKYKKYEGMGPVERTVRSSTEQIVRESAAAAGNLMSLPKRIHAKQQGALDIGGELKMGEDGRSRLVPYENKAEDFAAEQSLKSSEAELGRMAASAGDASESIQKYTTGALRSIGQMAIANLVVPGGGLAAKGANVGQGVGGAIAGKTGAKLLGRAGAGIGGTLPASLAFGGSRAVSAAREAEEAGLSYEEKGTYVKTQVAAEVGIMSLFSALGAGGLETGFSRSLTSGGARAFLKDMGLNVAGEIAEENLTEFAQKVSAIKSGVDKGELTWDVAKGMFAETTIATLFTMGLMEGGRGAATATRQSAAFNAMVNNVSEFYGVEPEKAKSILKLASLADTVDEYEQILGNELMLTMGIGDISELGDIAARADIDLDNEGGSSGYSPIELEGSATRRESQQRNAEFDREQAVPETTTLPIDPELSGTVDPETSVQQEFDWGPDQTVQTEAASEIETADGVVLNPKMGTLTQEKTAPRNTLKIVGKVQENAVIGNDGTPIAQVRVEDENGDEFYTTDRALLEEARDNEFFVDETPAIPTPNKEEHILNTRGNPYQKRGAAKTAAIKNGLGEENVIEVEGGFAVARNLEPAKTENQEAAPTESNEVAIQKPVDLTTGQELETADVENRPPENRDQAAQQSETRNQAKPMVSESPGIAERVSQAFPGSTVTPREDGRGYTVEVPSGQNIDVLLEYDIPMSPAAVMKGDKNINSIAEAQARIASIKAEGGGPRGATIPAGFKFKLSNGEVISSSRITVLIDPRNENNKTAMHEAKHVAFRLGFANTRHGRKIAAALEARHGTDEEAIVKDIELWKGPEGLWAKIRAFFEELLAMLPMGPLSYERALAATFKESFWRNDVGAGKPQGSDVNYQIQEAVDILSTMEGLGQLGKDEFFGGPYLKALRQIGSLRPIDRNMGMAVRRAVADIVQWLNDNPRFLDYYRKDTLLTEARLRAWWPEMTADDYMGHRLFLGLASPNTALPINVAEALQLTEHVLRNGGSLNDLKVKSTKTVDKDGKPITSWTQVGSTPFGLLPTKIRSLHVIQKWHDELRSWQAVANYMAEAVPMSDLKQLNKEAGYGPLGKVGPIRETVMAATGQEELIPRAFMFGPKVGAYTMNTTGNPEFTTTDIWESRFIRSYFPEMFKTATGLPASSRESEIFQKFAQRFGKELNAALGTELPPSALQAARWFYILKKVNEAGYSHARTDETISHYTANTLDQIDPGRDYHSIRGQGNGDRGDSGVQYQLSPGEALPGTPVRKGATGPDLQIVNVAEQYAREKGIDLRRQSEYVEVDPGRAKRIAEAYERLDHNPKDPEVQAAYREMADQTLDQYRALEDAGYEFYFGNPDGEYLTTSPFNAIRELRSDKRMGVFKTTLDTFGDDSSGVLDSPLLEDTGLVWKDWQGNDVPVLVNDLFRAVHDAFGHSMEGSSFRARGEENAWQAHIRLYTGKAIGAVTTETRGQNSWVNFGPYGEQNATASGADTTYAEQKVGLMPEWTWTEGRAGDMGSQSTEDQVNYQLPDTQFDEYAQPAGAYQPNVPSDNGLLITHWSFKPSLKKADPKKNGTGGQGREGRRARDYPELWVPRTYFGFGDYKREDVVGGVRYGARINPDSLYDFTTDPLNLYPTPEELEEREYAPFDEAAGISIYEQRIKDAGFAGMASDRGSGQLFHPVDLTKVETGDQTITEDEAVMYQLPEDGTSDEGAETQPKARVGLAFKDFFSDVTKGTFGKSEIPFVPNLDLTGSEEVIKSLVKHSGNLSDHIFKSIPTFFEAQVGTAQAVSKLGGGAVKPSEGAVEFTVNGVPYTAPATYLRFGELPDGPSQNWLAGEDTPRFEKGQSVYKAYRNPKTGKYILIPNAFDETEFGETIMTHEELASSDRPLYEVAGDPAEAVGYDGEPLLKVGTGKVLRPVDRKDVAIQEDLEYDLNGDPTNGAIGFDSETATVNMPAGTSIPDAEILEVEPGIWQVRDNDRGGELVGPKVGKGIKDRTLHNYIRDEISLKKLKDRRSQQVKVLDIAGSEGSWGKTVTELSGGKVQTVTLDPNLDMKATFDKTSEVDGATFAADAFLNGFKDGDRDVSAYNPSDRFDVVHESMGFQFIDNNRRAQIDEVKRLMKTDGVFLTEQKFLNDNWEANEEYKNVNHKDKYFTAEELAKKDTRVGYTQSLAESEAVGMVDNMVTLEDFKTLLENTFEYVEMYWDSGNFQGFAASDSRENLRKVTGGIPDLTSEFSTGQAETVGPMYQLSGFYSPIERAVDGMKQETFQPQQLKGTLQKLPGVKAEEIDDIGLFDWLDGIEGKVTKAEVLEFIGNAGPEIEEVTKGGEDQEAEIDALLEDELGEGMDRDEAREYLGFDDESPVTKYEGYQMPGGENYREVLLTLPLKNSLPDGWKVRQTSSGQWGVYTPQGYRLDETYGTESEATTAGIEEGRDLTPSGGYKSSHWDERNVLAHIRLNDRTGPNGEKILFVEEIQSDWHQAGRKKGYEATNTIYRIQFEGLPPGAIVFDSREAAERYVLDFGEPAVILEEETSRGSVPSAPFKRSWAMLAFKRILRMAAEGGYDSVSWTPGDVQAERYDLSKQVDRVEVNPAADQYGNRDITITTKHHGEPTLIVEPSGRILDGFEGAAGKNLDEVLGKDLAKKIVDDFDNGPKVDLSRLEVMQNEDFSTYSVYSGYDTRISKKFSTLDDAEDFRDEIKSGRVTPKIEGADPKVYKDLDLKVGGDGMRGFYDQILPKEVGKYAKKLDKAAKVGTSKINGNREIRENKLVYNSYFTVHHPDGSLMVNQRYSSRDAAERLSKEIEKEVWNLPITDDMRTEILGGQPMYQLPEESNFSITSVKKERINELREMTGRGELPGTMPEDWDLWMSEAAAAITSDDWAASAFINELKENQRYLSPKEIATLHMIQRAGYTKYENITDRQFKAHEVGDFFLAAALQKEAEAQLKWLDEVEETARKVGSNAGRVLNAHKIALKEDFTIATLARKARTAQGGAPLNESQMEELQAFAKQIKDLQDQLEVEQLKNSDLQAKVNEFLKSDIAEAQVKPKAHTRKAQAATKKKKALDNFKSVWEKNGFTFNDDVIVPEGDVPMFQSEEGDAAQPKGSAPQFNPEEIKAAATQMAEAYLEDGTRSFTEFWAQISLHMGSQGNTVRYIFEGAWDAAVKASGQDVEPILTGAADITKEARRIQRALVNGGFRDLEQIVGLVQEAMSEVLFDRYATMEALSGYGQFSLPSKEEAATTIREHNAQLLKMTQLRKLELAKERADQLEAEGKTNEEIAEILDEEGHRLKATGPQRDKPTDIVRDLIAEINELKKKIPLNTQSREGLLQGAMASAKRAMGNQINDLERALKAKVPLPKKGGPRGPYTDPVLRSMQVRLEQLRKDYRAMFPPERATRKLTEEQRLIMREKALDRAIAELERQIAEDDLGPKKKAEPAFSMVVDAKLSRLNELRAWKDLILEIRNPKMSPEERARKTYIANLKTRIAEYQGILDKKDFAPKPKKEKRQLTPREIELKRQLEKKRGEVWEQMERYRIENGGIMVKAWDYTKETAHLSRAFMTSIDLSAVFRQGAIVSYGNPKLAKKAAAEMYKALLSEKGEFDSINAIRIDPMGHFAEMSGLSITEDIGVAVRQEEAYMGRWASKVPGIAASGRAYSTYLNNLRFQLFKQMVTNLSTDGKVTIDEGKAIASFINAATGRSDLKALNKKATAFNALFFAPRWVASRFQYLGMPIWLMGTKNVSPRVKRAILKEYVKTSAGMATTIGVLLMAAYLLSDDDDEVSLELNPLSTNFMRIKIGETRLDPTGALGSAIVFSSRFAAGRTKTQKGEIIKFGEGYKPTTRATLTAQFLRYKLAPIPGAAWTVADDWTNAVGQKVTPVELAAGLFVPLSIREVIDTTRAQNIPTGVMLNMLAIFGMGIGTYGEESEYRGGIMDWIQGNEPRRLELFNKKVRNIQWDDPATGYEPMLTEPQRQQLANARLMNAGLRAYQLTTPDSEDDPAKSKETRQKALDDLRGYNQDLEAALEYYMRERNMRLASSRRRRLREQTRKIER